MEDPREARRKKLMNRGSDRLAFITGQARALPDQNQSLSPPPFAGVSLSEDDFRGSFRTKSRDSNEISSVQPEIEKSNVTTRYEISNETVKHETKNTNNHSGAVSRTTSMVDRSSDRATRTAPRPSSTAVFTPRQISASISSSENIRLLCSLVIALLLILSHHGFPLFALGRIVSFRPLFLVLLTDATLILGPLLVNQGNEHRGKESARSQGKERDGWNTDLGGMLEAAMLLQKALGAAVMDCSICAVVMICGAIA